MSAGTEDATSAGASLISRGTASGRRARTPRNAPASRSTASRPATRKRRTAAEIAKAKRASEKRHAAHIFATYGITAEEYQAIYEEQEGTCYICRRANGKTRRLAVDHDHATGFVRGLLCKSCNRMLGHARDSRDFFERCIEYLRFPPAFDIIGDRKVPE